MSTDGSDEALVENDWADSDDDDLLANIDVSSDSISSYISLHSEE